MSPNDFLLRSHNWSWSMHWRHEATCWCEPFIEGLDRAGTRFPPMVFHRPDYGHVFHEHGEQGPQTVLQARCAQLVV
jgi:hypothetical protein